MTHCSNQIIALNEWNRGINPFPLTLSRQGRLESNIILVE